MNINASTTNTLFQASEEEVQKLRSGRRFYIPDRESPVTLAKTPTKQPDGTFDFLVTYNDTSSKFNYITVNHKPEDITLVELPSKRSTGGPPIFRLLRRLAGL